MSALFHASIKVDGEAGELDAFRSTLAPLLSEHAGDAAISEHRGAHSLCYDVKAVGGIPFPPFVIASETHPALTLAIEWVNAEAGASGSATIANGALKDQTTAALPEAKGGREVFIETRGDGYLRLALTFFAVARGEYCGYAITGERDALFKIARDDRAQTGELFATAGAAEWAQHWQIDLARRQAVYREIEPAIAIDPRLHDQASETMRDFLAQWIWFDSAPRDETIIERERYARRGLSVFAANLRSARFDKLKQGEAGAAAEFSSLSAGNGWVKDAIARYWLARDQ